MEKSPASALEDLCQQTVKLVEQVGKFITSQLGLVEEGQIATKSLNSLVSHVDTTAEQKLIAGLQTILPQAVFQTEEATIAPAEGEWCWIIDPLDGTTNFLHQLPCFAISVALAKGQQVVLGVVQEVNRRETFWAWKGGGAFCNGRPIHVSTTKTLAESLVSTGFPYYDFSRLPAYVEALTYLMQHTRGIRRWGAAAVDLAYVACGRYDAFFEYALNPWDVAAGLLLVEEAGGQTSDFSGGTHQWSGQEVIATNRSVFPVFQPRIAFHLNRAAPPSRESEY